MIKQSQIIAAPSQTDGNLQIYSQIIQSNFQVLFQSAHDHKIVTSNPKSTDGLPGNIYIVDTGTEVYAVIKVNKTDWYKTASLTAI